MSGKTKNGPFLNTKDDGTISMNGYFLTKFLNKFPEKSSASPLMHSTTLPETQLYYQKIGDRMNEKKTNMRTVINLAAHFGGRKGKPK